MASTEYIAIVTPEAAAAAFNRFTNRALAEESLRVAQEEVAYATSSWATRRDSSASARFVNRLKAAAAASGVTMAMYSVEAILTPFYARLWAR